MVCESHRTHGNKTRISSYTDPRTTICAPCFAYTVNHSLTSRLSLSSHTVIQNPSRPHTPHATMPPPPIATPPTHPPRPARLRVTELPRAYCMSFPHRLILTPITTHPRQSPLSRPVLLIPTYNQITRNFPHMSFRASFFRSPRPDFRLHPPIQAPRPHRPPASGRRVTKHLFPRAYLRVPVI